MKNHFLGNKLETSCFNKILAFRIFWSWNNYLLWPNRSGNYAIHAAFVIWLLSLIGTLCARELEFRYYTADEDGSRAVFNVIEHADRRIECDGKMKFTIGIGREIGNSVHLTEFDFDEIKPFLKKEKHKKMLVIWLGLDIMADDNLAIRDFVRRIGKMVENIGYQRVIILGGAGNGVHYLADTGHILSKPDKGSTYHAKGK